MAGHYPNILMTGHIGTNTPKFVPPRWGRPPLDPAQTGLCKFGWVWSSLTYTGNSGPPNRSCLPNFRLHATLCERERACSVVCSCYGSIKDTDLLEATDVLQVRRAKAPPKVITCFVNTKRHQHLRVWKSTLKTPKSCSHTSNLGRDCGMLPVLRKLQELQHELFLGDSQCCTCSITYLGVRHLWTRMISLPAL